MAAADMAVKMGQPAAAVTEYDTMCFWVEDGSVRLAMLPSTTCYLAVHYLLRTLLRSHYLLLTSSSSSSLSSTRHPFSLLRLPYVSLSHPFPAPTSPPLPFTSVLLTFLFATGY